MNTLQTYKEPKGTTALVRVDYNVPFKGTKIIDTSRIDASFKTINFLLKKGTTPILLAHLGDASASLRPVATYLSKHYKIVFVTNDLFDPRTKEIFTEVPKGTVILVENIRRYAQEESNDKAFAKLLASFADVYINDAFSVSHRAHASVVGVAKLLPSFGGYQLAHEIKALSTIVASTAHPFLCILGGAKFATKIPLLSQYEKRADNIVIGGAILNSFYTVAGFEIGASVAESGYEKPIETLLKNEKVLLPIDVIVLRGTKKVTTTPEDIQKGDVIVDIGPQSIALIIAKIQKAKVVVWNGPMGWYEKGFTKGTTMLAEALVQSKARAVIGGGDTGACVQKILSSITNTKVFVSTGGGAALEYLAKGTLSGIKALG